ncbi:hypothetical protein, partial [Nocardia farcinica]|uniref:hypothetical protein n=1 Tax=Nocardia farcinica TaxID=37329 RepID=UPI001559E56E
MDGVPAQVVLPVEEVAAQSDLVPEPIAECELPRRLAEFFGRTFDVAEAVPLRVGLFQLSESVWVLALSAHHI